MNDRSSIRSASLKDASAIQEIYAPYVQDTVISFELIPPDREEITRRLTDVLRQYPWLVYERDGMILGYAYASQHRTREAYRWSVDVAVYVRQGYSGKGIGSQLYDRLLEDVQRLGYANAFAGITLPNAASIGLHESKGFQPIGIYRKVGFKNGAWHDVGWWQRSFDHPVPPVEPGTKPGPNVREP
jgi:phosphinothricin acetyltransferase